ncbi:farnesyl diphosphate synthase [Chitinivorax sp. B]|uniref:polyprenyl synthetase family protein n=1 Tax=Chitinivorax sp. B TaxID=2502235 RepID=UPI0010F66582|nr:farnesyl diphosphate synthase [Chitinivorax sp. B]
MNNPEFLAWANDRQQHIETVLAQLIPSQTVLPQRLHDAMRYATLGGGKRVRPLLVYASGTLMQASPAHQDIAAAAVELIHAYSLVHDDLPCMDNDTLRRGKPTCHIEFDESTALLAGDALQTLAFDLLSNQPAAASPTAQLKMVGLLAQAAGSHGMAGGQAIDLASVGLQLSLPELEQMHILKTGALIRASVLLGAHAGSSINDSELRQLDHFAKCIGLAFQVVDDILDAESTSATLGKTAGKDAEQNKPTYVSLLGLRDAKAHAQALLADAQESLTQFGERANHLLALADFIVARKF